MNELHLFSGAGGGILGGILLGHTCVCAVEIEPYCRQVLLQRQRDGILPKFPIWNDVRTFDGKPWRGLVDVVCGGFPCQDISAAGSGTGLNGERSGLWSEMARIICEIRPDFAFIENSPMLTFRGLNRVLSDISSMGYDARWGVFGSISTERGHRRNRLFLLAYPTSNGLETYRPNTNAKRSWIQAPGAYSRNSVQDNLRTWVESGGLEGNGKSPLRRTNDGMAFGVDRLKAIGNGQIPSVVQLAWETLMPKRLEDLEKIN